MMSATSPRPFLPALLLAILPLAANSQMLFVEGGYAETCARAAQQADDPDKIVLTGSRLGLSPLEICTRAIDESGENRAVSYNNRGVLYFAMGDFDAAIDDFDQAIALRESVGQFHINKGLALVREQRWQDSIAAFDRGITLGGDKLDEAYYNRGIANEETGNITRAYYDYKAAADLNPSWEAPRDELKRFSVR